MRKTVWRVALCAGLFSLPAGADTGNISVYGTLNVDLESVKATGAADPAADYVNRFRIQSNSSNFGIKGDEKIAKDLSAVFQLEMSVDVAAGYGEVSGRNSMVGLSGELGTIIYGKWDTPYRNVQAFMDPFYSTGIGYLASILDTMGQGSTSTTFLSGGGSSVADALSFSRRQGNSIQYWSPDFVGASVKLAYSTNRDRSSDPSNHKNPDLLSAALNYEQGPINLGVAYEQHDDFMSASAHPITGVTALKTQDRGFKIAAGFKPFEDTSLGVAWDVLKYGQYTDFGDSFYKRNALALSTTQKLDEYTVRGAYGFATDGTCTRASGAACDTAGLGAEFATIGGSYSLSGRTDLYVIFSKIWNGNNNYNFAIGQVNAALPAGADPQGLGLGIRHNF
ncbi:MAG: hypothetical protein A2428_15850 [Bdellovibrionales bacterium RIFOXYC1_FULL_54_43]|nr:MAG: hypothetical protein A2428_15850 [Bdellovibrionales bacterium RIFOXYC1_FULL_54_43]OFZ85392.1 MAG: hypothetical protein A2603_00770 [Bdellovibrionales bacterium RIFOXYD1_FULL_55_31]